MESSDYPVRFSIDYPDRSLDRLTSFFRIFAAIPIMIVLERRFRRELAVDHRRGTNCRGRAPAACSFSDRCS